VIRVLLAEDQDMVLGAGNRTEAARIARQRGWP